ncbi:DUF5069 domain-containing protein [bacterium]|nr:DUF5069 domain-containing protein [bacterium]
MSNQAWESQFQEIYDNAQSRYRGGRRSPSSLFGPSEVKFLNSIGCTAQELFDYIEDGLDSNDPSYSEVLKVTTIRKDYFLNELNGRSNKEIIQASQLPSKSASVEGIRWLPRIIGKAKAKLHGQLSDDLMYGCGGDRPFLRSVNLTLSEFLIKVRDSKDDKEVIDFVIENAKR